MNTQPESASHHGPSRRIEEDLHALERDHEQLRQVEAEIERDETRLEHDLHSQPRPPRDRGHNVQMNYRPLTLHGQRLSGLQVKEQAIAGGIPHIQPDFHLTVERAGHHDDEHTVGDNDVWTVHQGDCFTAVKPDDNS